MQNFAFKFGRLLVVLALFVSIGAHWALLQSVAWTQMIVERSSETTFAEAVKTTLSGDAPCAMCLRIAEETQKENQPENVQIKPSLDFIFEMKAIAFFPPNAPCESSPAITIAGARSEKPPFPPPRRA